MPDQDPVIEEFRANGGCVGGYFTTIPLLLLTTTGARTGQPRTMPLAYMQDGERWIVAAGAGGAAKHPAWYFNLVADPAVTVEIGEETFSATPVVTASDERQRLFERFAAEQPQLVDYAERTTREIPIVALVTSSPG